MQRNRLLSTVIFFIVLIIVVCSAYYIGGLNKQSELYETYREEYGKIPGVKEARLYVSDTQPRNERVHILRIDKDAGVNIIASYPSYYKSKMLAADGDSIASDWSSENWDFETVIDQARDYEKAEADKGEIIAASNGDFYNMDSGDTIGALVLEGKKLHESRDEPYFAIMKNGEYEVRHSDDSFDGVYEAIGGSDILIEAGEKANLDDKVREPRQAIGVAKDGDIILVNVDGREPHSPGMTLKDLAIMMEQQECVDAINLDGGGSCSFITKRELGGELEYRNNPTDGKPREVTSSLLFIRRSTVEDKDFSVEIPSMQDDKTKIYKDKEGFINYKVNDAPQSGLVNVNSEIYLLDKNGKGETKSIKIGDVSYNFEKGILKGASKWSGKKILMGYCGDEEDGHNIVFAFHEDGGILNIDVNEGEKGSKKMRKWDNPNHQPWFALKSKIKKVIVDDDVEVNTVIL